jgi:diadenosine tetraphosphate (Ap4A) HIT family hydrolase
MRRQIQYLAEMVSFALDPRLEAESIFVADLGLCQARLMNDRRFPWLVLVPQRAGLADLTDLPREERLMLVEEVAQASLALSGLTAAHKMNVAALGNHVRQFHVHIIARFTSDPAWPNPVWGLGAAEPYAAARRDSVVKRLATSLSSTA